MRIALVHDHLTQHGGAERVLEALQALYPQAPTYTLLYDARALGGMFDHKEIRQSFLASWPLVRRLFRWYLPFMPAATEHYDLSEFDVVISSASAFAKGVITHPGTVHISYCHAPTRYLWSDANDYLEQLHAPRLVKALLPLILHKLRLWDVAAAQRPDILLANSTAVRERIARYYHREAQVLHPPVDTHLFRPSLEPKTYYLAGGRLVGYKKIADAILACNALGVPLRVFGTGPALPELQRIAGPTVRFYGRVSDHVRAELFANAIAYLHPQEEDFGITAVEAMATGRPVIALNRGGATETVIDGVTGVLFSSPTVEGLTQAIAGFDATRFSPAVITAHAQQFATAMFRNTLHAIVEKAYADRHRHPVTLG